MNSCTEGTKMEATDLIYLLQQAVEARQAERAAFEGYGGYSWGYHGGPLIEAASNAERAFADGMAKFVDERVAAALQRHSTADQ